MARKITYINKVDNNGLTTNGKVFAADMNEIKAAINENADILDGKSFNEISIVPTDLPQPPPTDTNQDQIYVPTTAGTYVNFPTSDEPNGIVFNPDNGITKIYGNSVKGFRRIDYAINLSGYYTSSQTDSAILAGTSDLNNEVFGSVNVTPDFTTWVSGFINTSGAEQAASTYRRTGFLPVTAGEVYQASLSGSATVLMVSSYSAASQANFVANVASNVVGSSPTGVEPIIFSFEIPTGVTHIRLSRANSTPITSIYLRIKTVGGSIIDRLGGIPVTGIVWSSGFINVTGGDGSSSNYMRSNFLPVSQGQVYGASLSGTASTLMVAAYSAANIANFIPESEINILGSSPTGVEPVVFTFRVPLGVTHIRIGRSNLTPLSNIYFNLSGLEDRVSDLENKENGTNYDINIFSASKNYVQSRIKPTFAMCFDDLRTSDELVFDVFKDFRFSPSYAIQTSNITDQNIIFYQEAYMQGASILAHSTTGGALPNHMTGSKLILEQRGFKISGWVTPSSTLDPTYLPDVKRIFGYGFTSTPPNKGVFPTTGMNQSTDPCELLRVSLEVWNTDETNQAAIKQMIDYVITNNLLCVFYAHQIPSTAGTPSPFTETDLRGVLTYLRTKVDAGDCLMLGCDDAIYQYYRNYNF